VDRRHIPCPTCAYEGTGRRRIGGAGGPASPARVRFIYSRAWLSFCGITAFYGILRYVPYSYGMAKRIEFVWDDGLVERVDAARGDVSRSRWVQRAVESQLSKPAPPSEVLDRKFLQRTGEARLLPLDPDVPSVDEAIVRAREIVEPAEDWAWERQQRLNRNRKP
jgi:hypothetical protein